MLSEPHIRLSTSVALAVLTGLIGIVGIVIASRLNLKNTRMQHDLKARGERHVLKGQKLEALVDLVKRLDELVYRPQQTSVAELNTALVSINSKLSILARLYWQELEPEIAELDRLSSEYMNISYFVERGRTGLDPDAGQVANPLDQALKSQEVVGLCIKIVEKAQAIGEQLENA